MNRISSRIMYAVLAVIASAFLFCCGDPRSNIEISGDSALLEYEIIAEFSPKLAGYTIGQHVYEIAMENKYVERIKIELEVSFAGGLVDSYGHEIEGPYRMGTIVVSDLTEVRRYKDTEAYALRMADWYAAKIRTMKYADMLADEP